jgi:hypothetical protein
MIKRPKTSNFRGLNNITDPLRLNLGWLVQADNVDVTDKQQLVRGRGFTRKTTNSAISGAYTTLDLQRMYLIDAGQLRQMNPDFTYSVLRTGLSAGAYYFEEVNGVVYYTNGTDYGSIEPDGARPWGAPVPNTPNVFVVSGGLNPGYYQVVCTLVDARGMESANSDVANAVLLASGGLSISNIQQVTGYTTNVYATTANGTVFYRIGTAVGAAIIFTGGDTGPEIPFWNLNLPRGIMPAHFQSRLHLAEPDLGADVTQIWRSLPLQYHHFDPSGESLAVPGIVRMLRASQEALIIGTDRAVFAWNGETLAKLAEYGVVPGYHASRLGNDLYFWSLRGLCVAMPFKNLTEGTVSVAPGLIAGATVMEKEGIRRYVVALQKGGVAYNARSQ